MSPKLRTLLVILAVVVPLDQLTKQLVVTHIAPGRLLRPVRRRSTASSGITHSRNSGAALGLLQNVGPYSVRGAHRCSARHDGHVLAAHRPARSALGGGARPDHLGALGNLFDRVVRREVIDWAQFNLGLFIFPDFNVADSAIVIGVALLILDMVTQETESGVASKAPGNRDG